jgi:nicotinate phosphoribosyltransferase
VRFSKNGKAISDMIYLESTDLANGDFVIIDPIDPTKRKKIKAKGLDQEVLLKPIFEKGKKVYALPDIHTIKENAARNLAQFDKALKRLVNPHIYPVGLEDSLYQMRNDLVFKMKNYDGEENNI